MLKIMQIYAILKVFLKHTGMSVFMKFVLGQIIANFRNF